MEHFFEKIEGWSSYKDQGCLINLVLYSLKNKNNLRIAEIGVYKGRCTAMWNVELINKKIDYEYYAIDNFEGSYEHKVWGNAPKYEEALNNLSPVIDRIKLMTSDSIEASMKFEDEYFDIIYIDASHDYESVKKDILSWLPKLKKNGIICGDDYSIYFPGVVQAVNEVFPDKVNLIGDQQWWINSI